METKPIKTKGKATEFDKNLGLRLKGKRLLRGMSQQDLAAETGLSFQQIQKYEKGTNRITVSRLYDICNTLDLTVSDFLEDHETPRLTITKEQATLFKSFGKLEPEIRIQLIGLVKALAA